MKPGKYYMSMYGLLLVLVILAVITGDSSDLCLVIFYMSVLAEVVSNPVAMARYFKKSRLPEWLTPMQKAFYVGGYVILMIFVLFLIVFLPEKLADLTAGDYLVLAAFTIIGLVSGLMRRRILLHDAPDDIESVDDLIHNLEEEEIMETYATVKSFNDLNEAESFQKELEEQNIPSMIYGANCPDYIPRDTMPIQVMVMKRYKDSVDKYIGKDKS